MDNFNHFLKNFEYFFEFIKYLVKFSYHPKWKVELNFLEVWVGQRCTLRCEHCLHLIPYLKEHNLYDIDELIEDIKKIQKYANIKHLSIAGGEPFTHPELYKLLNFIKNNDAIETSEVVSNVTLIPNEPTLKALKELGDKNFVRVDIYPNNEERGNKFLEICNQNNINTKVIFFPKNNVVAWWNAGGPNKKINSIKDTISKYNSCTIKDCNSLAEGIFSPCCRGIVAERIYNQKPNKFEIIDIRKIKMTAIGKALLAISTNKMFYKDFCQYCDGLSPLAEEVVPGIQLKQEKVKI